VLVEQQVRLEQLALKEQAVIQVRMEQVELEVTQV
jgi:hypothetical protein